MIGMTFTVSRLKQSLLIILSLLMAPSVFANNCQWFLTKSQYLELKEAFETAHLDFQIYHHKPSNHFNLVVVEKMPAKLAKHLTAREKERFQRVAKSLETLPGKIIAVDPDSLSGDSVTPKIDKLDESFLAKPMGAVGKVGQSMSGLIGPREPHEDRIRYALLGDELPVLKDIMADPSQVELIRPSKTKSNLYMFCEFAARCVPLAIFLGGGFVYPPEERDFAALATIVGASLASLVVANAFFPGAIEAPDKAPPQHELEEGNVFLKLSTRSLLKDLYPRLKENLDTAQAGLKEPMMSIIVSFRAAQYLDKYLVEDLDYERVKLVEDQNLIISGE